MKDGAEIQTKLSTDFATTLTKEGAETAAALCPGTADPVFISGKQSDLTPTMQGRRADPPPERHRPPSSCQYHPGAAGSRDGCISQMFTSSQGCKWDRGMGLLPDLTQGPTASPAQTLSKPLTRREKQHHPQVPVPQNPTATKANSLKATKLPAPWHRPPAPAGI